MMQGELVSKPSAVYDPDKVLVKLFSRLAFVVGHSRMLNLNHNACRCDDIGAVDFAIWRGPRLLPAFCGKEVLPIAVPLSFVLPPRIAVATRGMRPMMYDTRAAFGYHGCPAGRTST